MIQCKLCGTPLGREPTDSELELHWETQHLWHKTKHPELTVRVAILKGHI